MSRALEFIGLPGPHRDPERFVRSVKRARPVLTDHEIVTVVRRANAVMKPRHRRSHWQVFGADILGTLAEMDAWPFLQPRWQRLLARFPLTGGELLPDSPEGRAALEAAIHSGNVGAIDRRSLLRPAGLGRSYVWCRSNAWVQEVTDADAAILRATPVLNRCFRDRDAADGPLAFRTYEYGAADRIGIASAAELEAFERDRARRPQWSGR